MEILVFEFWEATITLIVSRFDLSSYAYETPVMNGSKRITEKNHPLKVKVILHNFAICTFIVNFKKYPIWVEEHYSKIE